jgi:UDP-glucose:(heptosyl)LPS alpha-1,3-glucosyltransferase
LKIALVHMRHAHAGGTERYLEQVATFLAERGDEVTIVCRSHESAPHPAVRFELLRPLALGAAARMHGFARAVERHVSARSYDLVYGLGKTWTHDVVRLGGGCHATYLERAHVAASKPWERALGARTRKHRLALSIEERALAPGRVLRVVVNSRMVADDVARRHGVPAERIALVHNGVDLERYSPALRATAGRALRTEVGLAPDERVALFLGSGYGRKGLDVALAALARTRDLRLLVVGYDSELARHRELARKLGVAERALFLGGRRDTEACYAAADLYVLPTRYDPFANTTLEALASGLPVITSASNGASELIEEGVHGSVLASAADHETLAARMSEWSEPERLRRGAQAARALAERHSARSKCAQSAAVLDAVAQEKRAALATS